LNLKRSNNIGIILSSQFKGLTPEEIARAVVTFDVCFEEKPVGAQLTVDRVKALHSIFPLAEHEVKELKQVREQLIKAKQLGQDKQISLAKSDKLLVELIDIPRLEAKLNALHLISGT